MMNGSKMRARSSCITVLLDTVNGILLGSVNIQKEPIAVYGARMPASTFRGYCCLAALHPPSYSRIKGCQAELCW